MRADEYNSFEKQLARYRAAISRIERFNFKVASGSRLRVYERRIERLVSDPRPAVEADLVFSSSFDLREIDEIIEIVTCLPGQPDPATLDLLGKLVGGTEHPDDERGASAREAQYELYLGSVFRRAGIPTQHGAPDLACQWRDQSFFIEAKRPASSNRLDDRLRSAVHQIRRLSQPGIIAINADQLVRPSGGILTVREFDDLAPAVERLVIEFTIENGRVLRRRLIGEPVAALLWTARVPARILATGHSALGTVLKPEVLADTSGVGDFVNQAVEAYIRAQNG
jgi:hypothetical protein